MSGVYQECIGVMRVTKQCNETFPLGGTEWDQPAGSKTGERDTGEQEVSLIPLKGLSAQVREGRSWQIFAGKATS